MDPTLIIVTVCSLLAAFKIYNKVFQGKCTSNRRMTGKTVIITGGNSGIGKETAKDLARRGAKVILACRDVKRAKEAAQEIIQSTGNANIVTKQLDVGSLKSVRQFAEEILKEESRLDVLINNAGNAGTKGSRVTEDNLQVTLAVNYFGHFLLTHLLLDLLKKSAPSRIVNVSSVVHKYGKLAPEELNGPLPRKTPQQLYNDSKLCQIMFSKTLAESLKGTGVTVNSLHPGAVNTNIFKKLPAWQRYPFYVILWLFFKTAEEGAQTSLHLAVSEKLEGVTGQYFSDCAVTSTGNSANDEEKGRKLYDISLKLTGLK